MTDPSVTGELVGSGRVDPAGSVTGSARAYAPRRRASWKSVALPSEHGGWGLTAEPGLLGILLAPGWSSLWIAVAALLAFTARTPLKILAVDLRRKRMLERTRLAALVGIAELALLAACATAAVATAAAPFYWPLLAAVPLVGLQAFYDVRSRSRRLVPELAGAVGVCAVAAMAVLAGGGSALLATGAWLVLSGRAVASIPWVRAQVMRLHQRSTDGRALIATDATALVAATAAFALEPSLWPGSIAVAATIGAQRLIERAEPMPAPRLGAIQMAMGFAVVAITAIGVALA
ncbi:MAG: YwiC-like family protein [Microthrixaceae bacterium]|nr:YwiC-like family protein [Microthrixaceae bacterium]